MKTKDNKLTTDNGQKQAEAIMQAGLQLLPLIMNNIPQAVFWKDCDLVYLGCNQAFADDTGFSSPEEIVGKTDFDMPWKDQAELYRADDRLVMEKGEPKLNYEEPQTTPSGSTIWLSTSKIPVYENGQIVAVLGMYEDITARKQAEADLLLRDRALASSLNAVIIVNISDNKPIYVNDTLLKMTGYTREEAMQIGLSDITGNAEEPKKIRSIMKAQGSFIGEELLKRKDGSIFPANFFSSLIIDAEGRPIAVQTSFFDISERKQVEKAIQESEERFRRFTEATNEGLVFHEQGRIVDANPAALAMFGLLDSTEFIGQSLLQFLVPESHEMVLKQMQLENVLPYEVQCLRKDSTIFPVETSTRTYKIDDRTIRATSIRDITSRKQAEQALRDSEARYSAVVTQAQDGIVIIQDNILRFVNRAMADMVGSTTAEVENTPIIDYIAPESKALIVNRIKARLAGQEVPSVYEAKLQRKDGTIFDAELSAGVIEYRGKPADVGMIRDISERKKIDETLRESEERFRRFTDATVEGLVFHEQGKIVDVNPAAVAIFGRTNVDELIGTNLMEFIVPEFHQLVLKQMQLESVLPYEIQGIRKDGSTVSVETSTRTYQDGNRTIRASSIRDITERKQLEADKLREKNVSDTIVNSLPGIFYMFDAKGKLIRRNKNYEAVAGYSAEETATRNALDAVAEEDRERVAQAIQRAFIEGKVELEVLFQTRHGEKIPYFMTAVRMSVGDNMYVVGTGLDLSVRKQLEAQVQEAFERRGYQVQISTEISQEVAAASELSDLFDRVVTLTKERLGYYHTQLLRYDAAQDAVVLINGYGETGQKMLAGGHQMPMGEGLIGTAAASGETVLRSTLAEDPDWHPNPLLPDTQGEIAVPIKWQDTVLGVLDVQSNQAGALAEDDRMLLEGLCGQIAIAMHSAELVEAVRQNEARLAEALRTARLANWEYDVEKDIFTFNDQFYSIFHTTAEKAGGYQLSSARYAELFVYPDDMNLVGAEIGKALSSTERVYNTTIDHRILYADGGIGYITVKLTVERDENGKITRYYGANQDVTERKQAEARLAEALRTARLANWEYDVEKDIFTFNDQFYSIFHTTAEKAGGYQLSSARYAELFVHPDDMEVVGIEIGKALSSTERVYNTTIDHRIRYDDGGIGYIMVKLTVERDENGKITRYYGANQDITERKQAETRLAEALRTARLANWEYDVEKDIFTFNDQFYSIFHTTAEKAGGYQLSSARYAELFVHPDDMEVVGTEIGKALSSTERVYNTTIDHRIRYDDGGIGYITVKLTVERDENGKITRYYGANQDITERKQAEEALRRNEQEMAERLEEVNRLYRNMSHEGWQTYRQTADLPAGFMFDQAGIRPVDDAALADELFANIPMKVLGGETVGMLTVANDPQHPTSPEDYAFLQQVSDQIALALESARLFEQTQSALAQSEKLFEASRHLTQATDLQELVASVIASLEIPEINRALLVTFDYDAKGDVEHLNIIGNWWNKTGHEITAIGTRYPREVIRVMPMFISQTPVFFNDTLDDERVDATTLELVKRLNLRAVAVLPLRLGTHQIGALILEAEEPHTFTQDEIRLFSALAPQVATVLENRRQFERAQKQADRESTLNLISQKIQGATSVEAVLQIAARELGHALGAPRTIAQLSIKDKK